MNNSRLDRWVEQVKAAQTAYNEASDNAPAWVAPNGTDVTAGVDLDKSLVLRSRTGCDITLPEAAALALAQFIVNWYTPKPVSIL